MDLDPVLLSRIQFAFVISFHIIFPAFTIGLAAWLATIEGMRLATGNPVYRRVFDFWLKVFALSFGMGVVTGIVMAFQFGTNWSVLAERTGSIQGPLLGYEAFTAFMLEATFFGVMLLGRDRGLALALLLRLLHGVARNDVFLVLDPRQQFSWMQVPLGHAIVDGKIIPADWRAIVLGPVMMVRWPHMLLAAFLTTGMSVIATGAWYLLRGRQPAEARVMLHWGLGLVAVIIPVQLFFGHLTGLYVLKHQPAKFAAIEARWQSQQPASEVLIAWPDEASERNLFAIEIPRLGSFIASGNWTAREIGLETFPVEDRPPVRHPLLRVPRHGRHGADHARRLLVRQLPALARTAGNNTLVPLGRVPVVSDRIRRRALRLVHRRGRPPALGRLRPSAHQGRGDALACDRRRRVFAPGLHRWSMR